MINSTFSLIIIIIISLLVFIPSLKLRLAFNFIFNFIFSLAFNLLILGFLSISLSSCSSQNNDVQGYVGVENRSIDGGVKTPQSNLIFMATDTAALTVVEGSELKILIQLSRPVPRKTAVTWSLENGEKDFEVASASLDLEKDIESFEVNIKSLTDGVYRGDHKYNFKIVGDATVFFSALLVSLAVKEIQSLPILSFDTFKETLGEDVGSAQVKVNLSQASLYSTRVRFTVGGTAKNNRVDYYLSETETLIFNPGETQKSIVVYLTDDTLASGTRDILFTLTEVDQGVASIDTTNNVNRFFIEDNDLTALFKIRGASGGTDTLVDDFLTSGTTVTAFWTDTPYETAFKVSILALNGSTVICPEVPLAADVLSYTFTGCALNEGSSYRIHVVATIEGVDQDPGTQNFLFRVDSTPPGDFYILGAFGGRDTIPDKFLAGTLVPSIGWTDSTGEAYYKVTVLNLSNTVEVCPEARVPANVSAYTFYDCFLTANSEYLVRVHAFDSAGNWLDSNNNTFTFTVTEIPAGYLIKGLTGGTADVTFDDNMDDGIDPVVTWEPIEGATRFEVSILNMNNTDRCTLPGPLTGDQSSVKFTNCPLFLHDQYKVRVVAYDVHDIQYPAANSPYVFRYRVGLYISGTGGSYYRGLPIYDCGGSGDLCSTATPYVLKDDLDERQIRVSNNGVMTGLPWVSGPVATKNGHLKVSADFLKLDNGGTISMSGKGYGGSNGPGLGSDGNPASGGAHGGNGSYVSGLSQAHSYDAVKLPADAGSGGGSNGANAGGAGGGILDVTVRENLEFSSGILSSDGLNGAGTRAGGGAGGSLILHTKNLTGAGVTIRTNGGAGNSTGGPGSGGRVAIYYTNITSSGGFNGLGLTSRGGGNGSSAGTIYYKADSDAQGSLLLDNGVNRHSQGVETPIPLLDVFDDINSRNYGTFIIEAADTYTALSTTINYRVVVAGVLQLPANDPHLTIGSNGYIEWRRSDPFDDWSHITILRSGVLTHSYNSNAETYTLDIQTTTLDLSGSINMSGRGYAATQGPGFAGGRHGAAYGGMGGYDVAGTPGSSYGSIKNPNQLGSGGGVSAGGGYIKISTSDLNFTGSIRANGAYGCGAGSGGSIHLSAVNINGSGGSISSAGGDCDICAGGGGGRVAVYYTNTTYLGGVGGINYEINGGVGNIDGASGTVFYKTPTDPNGNLLILNGSRNYNQLITTNMIYETLKFDSIRTDFRGTLKIPSGKTFELPTLSSITYRLVLEGDIVLPGGGTDLTIGQSGYLEMRRSTPLIFNKITIDQGGLVTHSYNGASRDYIVYFQANDFILRGTIDVSGRGYTGNQGPGKSTDLFMGAGYGGYGGSGNLMTPQEGGAPYDIDKIKAPLDLGSGTIDSGIALGASGGGAIRLTVANKFTLNGFIKADGYGGSNPTANLNLYTGGGSGGSVYITTNIIDGSGGMITANGGNGIKYGTACLSYNGSGGRIALIYTTDSYGTGLGTNSLVTYEKVTAFGGTYYDERGAAAGSVFLRQMGVDLVGGRIYYNNGPHSYFQKAETPIHSIGGVIVDSFATMNQATLLVPSGQTFNLPSSTLSYRLVVEGSVVVPGNDLIIAKGGYFEWRQSGLLNLDELTIQNGGVLTHSYNYTAQTYFLNLSTRLFTLDGGGTVALDARGFQQGSGPGVIVQAGAAYGGRSYSNLPYGSYSNPSDLGSGGGYFQPNPFFEIQGTRGGGMLKLVVAETTSLNGLISANADSEPSRYGGTGGTININTDILKGNTAALRADGATGVTESGSGGRISILYNDDQYGITTMNISAFGGMPLSAAGTIFYKNKINGAEPNGHLIVRNTGRTPNPIYTTLLPDGALGEFLDSIVVDNSVYVEVGAGKSFTLPSPIIT